MSQDGRPIVSIHVPSEPTQESGTSQGSSGQAAAKDSRARQTSTSAQQSSNHGRVLQRHIEASGVVPQILLAAQGRLSPHSQIASQLSDFTFLVSFQAEAWRGRSCVSRVSDLGFRV